VNRSIEVLSALWAEDPGAGRVVPPSGLIARLTGFAAAAMAFLCVFALALSLATGRIADRWASELGQSLTIRVSAPAQQADEQVAAVLNILETTPGVARARALSEEEQRALLEPWLGADLPFDTLPVPRLIEVIEGGRGFDPVGLRQRLTAEAPGAVLDDHARWRDPMVRAANRLRLLGVASILLIALTTAAVVTLAASAALAANAQVIGVLRLVGARDAFIARAFVRRFTLRALGGALAGTALGMLGILALPRTETTGGFLTGLGFQGWHWLVPIAIPPLVALVAFGATRMSALRVLKGTS